MLKSVGIDDILTAFTMVSTSSVVVVMYACDTGRTATISPVIEEIQMAVVVLRGLRLMESNRSCIACSAGGSSMPFTTERGDITTTFIRRT